MADIHLPKISFQTPRKGLLLGGLSLLCFAELWGFGTIHATTAIAYKGRGSKQEEKKEKKTDF
jgi:hypothetical protein